MGKDYLAESPGPSALVLLGSVLALSAAFSVLGVWRFLTDRSESITPHALGLLATMAGAALLANLTDRRLRLLIEASLVANRLLYITTPHANRSSQHEDLLTDLSFARALLQAVKVAGGRREALQLQEAILASEAFLRSLTSSGDSDSRS